MDPPVQHPYDVSLEEMEATTGAGEGVQESPPAPMRWIPPEPQVQQSQYVAEAVTVGRRPGEQGAIGLDPALKESIEICLRTTVKVRAPCGAPCPNMFRQD
jgi:hypothetical protein